MIIYRRAKYNFSNKAMCLLVVGFLVVNGSLSANNRLDSLLNTLDKTIEAARQFDNSKNEQIANLKIQLQKQFLSKEDEYSLYRSLSKEYDAYVFDSAKIYTERSVLLAKVLDNCVFLHESQIQLAVIHARAGMFSDAIQILNSIDKKSLVTNQLFSYYKAFSDTYFYWKEYLDGMDTASLENYRKVYQDSALQWVDKNSCDFAINFGVQYIEQKRFSDADRLLHNALLQVKPSTRDYSVLTSILAYLYEVQQKPQLQMEYLTLSALSDVKASVKENNSLRLLAMLLFADGNIDRANCYIKKCLEDANFYHARLRNIQISKVLPIIDQAYQRDRELQENRLKLLLVTVSLLSLILIISIYLVFRQMKNVFKAKLEIQEINIKLNVLNENLQVANDVQKRTNLSLAEANLVKEQYIGSFLEISTEYIDKFESFKTMVNRKIAVGQKNDIIRLMADSEDSIRDLKKLYESFDRAFLNIYPNFVEELNKLLRNDEQYPILSNTLNQELRIFALIRLGITDSNKMATFLHYSLRTIYNYRSKVKSKAVNQDENFEERVKLICSVVNN